MRCISVSVVNTVISLSTLGIATAVLGITAWLANVMATIVATGPSYHLNWRWTWGLRDVSDPWREIMPLWMLSFAGLALSTLVVGVADSWAAGIHVAPVRHTGALLGAHLSGSAPSGSCSSFSSTECCSAAPRRRWLPPWCRTHPR